MFTNLLLQSTQKFKFSHLNYLYNISDKYSKSYENLVFMREFNVTMDDKFMIDFWKLNDFSNLIEIT